MSLLTIRTYPDPVLRQICDPVDHFDSKLSTLAADMAATMYAAPGVGLAAPQVGFTMRLMVIDVGAADGDSSLYSLVNPEIIEENGLATETEGCLSIPDLTEQIERPIYVVVRAQNLAGERVELDVGGLLARVICHEVDHLNGVLFVDHLRGLRRDRMKRRLRRRFSEAGVPA
ncbi:MAG: peptide deformylase [Thermoanaerobaculia bacterium]